MKLSNLAIRTLRESDSVNEATVKRLERLGYITNVRFYVGRTRASGTDGLPGRKNWHAGQFIYTYSLTEKGKEALAEAIR